MMSNSQASGRELLQRHAGNPILTAEDWPYLAHTVFNPGAVRLSDGVTLLLCRVEDRAGISHLCAARSADGVGDWTIDPEPTLAPDPDHPEECWGLEDPRVVWHEELQTYSVTCCSYSDRGPGVSLLLTPDFRHFERLGQILVPENKDAALFPRRIAGRWALLHRPVPSSVGGAGIWVSFSNDLRHWGDHAMVLSPRAGPFWDGTKVGLSTPPLETAQGWLISFHGARRTVAGQSYFVGLALLDLDAPSRCLQRSHDWIMAPRDGYEHAGDVDNVVFPCGHTLDEDGDTMRIYYGAADSSIGLAQGRLSQMLEWLEAAGSQQ